VSGGAPTGPRTVGELLEHVREDYEANGRDLSRPGFRAMAVQRLGAFRRNVGSPLARKPMGLTYRVLHKYVRNHYGIEIHATTTVGRRCVIAHQSGIVVHEEAVIGDDCKIRQGVTIGQVSGSGDRDGAPTIGDRVEIGVGAVVIGPITVGDDAMIGPNAVVVRDVPAGTVVMGPPARAVQAPATDKAPPTS
jgi:serine O-acetyltransferase